MKKLISLVELKVSNARINKSVSNFIVDNYNDLMFSGLILFTICASTAIVAIAIN